MVAFLMVFVVGAAFAFVPGTLTIGGNISIEPVDAFVRWNSATVSTSPAAVTAVHTANIVDGGGRADQNIEWEVTFEQPGSAILTVTALNDHDVLSALLAAPSVTFDAAAAAAHGLTVSHNFAALIGPLSNRPVGGSPTISPEGTITVTWDGITLPDGFDSTSPSTNPVLTISVGIGYSAIAP